MRHHRSVTEPIEQVLKHYLLRHDPAHILWVGTNSEVFPRALLNARPGKIWDGETPVALEDDQFDVALVDLIAQTDKGQALALVSRIRDLLARRLLVIVAADADALHNRLWQPTDFYALGMSRYAVASAACGPLHLYSFDIETYKQTPEWLNARDWANPELFGKHRW